MNKHRIPPQVGLDYVVNRQHYRCTAISNQAKIETAEGLRDHNCADTFIHLRKVNRDGSLSKSESATFYNGENTPSWFQQHIEVHPDKECQYAMN